MPALPKESYLIQPIHGPHITPVCGPYKLPGSHVRKGFPTVSRRLEDLNLMRNLQIEAFTKSQNYVRAGCGGTSDPNILLKTEHSADNTNAAWLSIPKHATRNSGSIVYMMSAGFISSSAAPGRGQVP